MNPVKGTTGGRRTLRCPCRGAPRRRRSTTIINPAPYVTPIVPRHPPCGRTRSSRETTGPRSPRERRHAAAVWVAHSARGSTGQRGEPATQSRHAVDGSLIVTNNGNGQNGLMAINPGTATIAWKPPLRAAWLGLARSGPSGADTIWASGGGTNQVYRFTRSGAEWHSDTATLADTSARLFAAGLAVVPAGGLIAVVGNLSDSVYLIRARSPARQA